MKQAFHNPTVEGLRQKFLETGDHGDAERWHEAGSWERRLSYDDPVYQPDDKVKVAFIKAATVFLGGFVLGATTGVMLGKTPGKAR